jgi:hypothetical protein
MSTSYSPKIVTDGLVLALDAANAKSYPGSGTAWADLSGNNNSGSLVAGVAFSSENSGVMVFDGTDDTILLPSSNSITGDNLQTLTVSVWIKYSKSTISRVIQLTGNSGLLLFALVLNEDAVVSTGTIALLTRNTTDTATNWLAHQDNYHLQNKYINVVGVINGASRQVYINGERKVSDTNGMLSVTGNTPNARIGSTTFTFQGNLGAATIYRRALSANEVLQNFNATRGRFGV